MITDINLINKIESALDSMRPFLEADGGNIELVEVTDDYIARVKLLGACQSCNISTFTLKAGIEDAVKRTVPEIIAVEAIDT